MTWTHRLLVLVVVMTLAGCATGASSSPPRGSQPPRARCLTDPNETGARPLIFLFCIESP